MKEMKNQEIIFKILVFFWFYTMLSSCNKEPIEYHEFIANFNKSPFKAEGQATEVIYTNKTLFNVYHKSLTTESEQFEIREIPFVSVESRLTFEVVDVIMAKVCSLDTINYSGACYYSAVAGEVVLQPITNGVIEGTFNFVMVNDKVDTDTINIENGKFKITYTTIWFQ